jgi:hypothetical protein
MPNALLWSTVIPNTYWHRMDNAAFTFALRDALGLPLVFRVNSDSANNFQCGIMINNNSGPCKEPFNNHHVIHANHEGAQSHRHSAVQNVFIQIARAAHLHYEISPKVVPVLDGISREVNADLDINISSNIAPLRLDFSVVSPSTKYALNSHITNKDRLLQKGWAATQHLDIKKQHYVSSVAPAAANAVHMVIFESTGGFHQSAIDVMDKLFNDPSVNIPLPPASTWASPTSKIYYSQALSVQIAATRAKDMIKINCRVAKQRDRDCPDFGYSPIDLNLF